ncbi:hypothetical protein [Nesterenkonia sp. HG001]|uniref:hypothetical protein n=1 Tax=Nesterenkonia sp. HG001 TaxID=2983207 RepID=UPI002AC3F1E0|nr:hypothetical protein [Nesterenkonia sp. HG001]MDZ5076754.1 hypothetical protein [Nesterenkonia sp. HG001]
MFETVAKWLQPLEPLDPVAGPLSALAAIFTAIIAIGALVRAVRDSHERTRPIVVPYAQIGPSFVHGALYLVVKNFGATSARDVRVTIDPPLPKFEEDENSLPIRDASAKSMRRRFEEPTRVLAPGQALANIWTNRELENEEKRHRDRHVKTASKSGDGEATVPRRLELPVAPDEFTVTVKYQDPTRRDWKTAWFAKRVYSETVSLRMKDYDWETKQNPGDGNNVEKRQAKAMEAVAWELWGR